MPKNSWSGFPISEILICHLKKQNQTKTEKKKKSHINRNSEYYAKMVSQNYLRFFTTIYNPKKTSS